MLKRFCPFVPANVLSLAFLLAYIPCLITGAAAAPAAQSKPDEAALRHITRTYFEAVARRDVKEVLALWNARSPQTPERRKDLEEFFARSSKNELFDYKVLTVTVGRGEARIAVEHRMRFLDNATQQLIQTPLIRRMLLFRKANGRWTIWSDRWASEDLAEALTAARNPREQAALLDRSKPLIDQPLWEMISRKGSEAVLRPQPRLEEGARLFAIALRVAEHLGDPTLIGISFHSLGMTHKWRNDYDAALESFAKAASHFGRAKPEPNRKGLLSVRTAVGWALFEKGESDGAIRDFQEGRVLAGDDRLTVASLTNSIGMVRASYNDAAALADYQAARDLYAALNHDPGVGAVLLNIGAWHLNRFELDDAQRSYEAAEPLLEDLRHKVSLWNGMGIVHQRRGNFAKALEYYEKSIHVSTGGDREGYAATLHYRGSLQFAQGAYAAAMRDYNECVKYPWPPLIRAGLLRDMAAVHRAQGRLDEALRLYKRSLEYYHSLNLVSSLQAAQVRNNIGNVHLDLYDQRRKQANLEAARQQFEVSKRDGHGSAYHTAVTTANLALVDLSEGKLSDARSGFEEAQKAAQALSVPELEFACAWGLADIDRRQGRLAAAVSNCERAVSIADRLRRQVAGGGPAPEAGTAGGPVAVNTADTARPMLLALNRQGFLERKTAPYLALVGLYHSTGQVSEAFRAAERSKARALLDMLPRGGGLDPRAPSNHLLQPNDEKGFGYDDAGELLTTPSLALAEYVVTPETTYLFVLSRARKANEGSDGTGDGLELHSFAIRIEESELRERVSLFQKMMVNRSWVARDEQGKLISMNAAAAGLYQLLLGPARKHLAGKRLLCIVPDGPLNSLPFQALQPTRGKFLIEDVAVFYAPSLSLLREVRRGGQNRRAGARSARPTLFAIGNPWLGDRGKRPAGGVRMGSGSVTASEAAHLPGLPEAAEQVRRLRRLYGETNSRVYEWKEATKSRFVRDVGRHSVVVIAAHSVADTQEPLRSRIFLAPDPGSNNGANSGILEAQEIAGVPLQAELVVLSACDTGSGRFRSGEGVVGLAWALFAAGSPRSVVSQWPVEAAPTTDIMVRFHEQLLRTWTRPGSTVAVAEAMREAVLEPLRRRRRADGVTLHPNYWAGFVVIGDGGF